MSDRPIRSVDRDDLSSFLERGRVAQLAADAAILTAVVDGNPNAERELARLRRVEAAAEAIWGFEAEGWAELGAALEGRNPR